ncbi:MAG TPA: hypothetical protein QGG47_09580, partial [Acidobacteriota bacterium]|nr:hypothetical protein [Acidobacteriota bacterium]
DFWPLDAVHAMLLEGGVSTPSSVAPWSMRRSIFEPASRLRGWEFHAGTIQFPPRKGLRRSRRRW